MATRDVPKKRNHRKLLVAVVIPLALLLILAAVFFVYTGRYYHAEDTVWDAAGQYSVNIQEENDYYACTPNGATADTGFVFYPGGKVEASAYLPYMAAVAEKGYLCVLLKVPFQLAILDMDAAGDVTSKYPDISTWVVGGHSLGGVAAAHFAANEEQPVAGLVLLASYPNEDLSQKDLVVESITATEDEVLDWEKYEEALAYLPAQTTFTSIQGGNHSQFGRYGHQKGDGQATISQQEQQDEVVAATVGLLKSV